MQSAAGLSREVLAAMLVAALAGCAQAPLPIDTRYRAQAQDSRVQFIVLHYTVGHFGSALFTLTEGPVSSHYLVDREPARVYRLVDESRRAWHAGPSFWQGHTSLNAASIGIEIVNPGFLGDPAGPYEPYADAQIDAVVALVRDIARRHGVRPHRIVGHSDISPQHKQDPGPRFPWRRLAHEGLIPWPDEAAVQVQRAHFEQDLPDAAWFQQRLSRLGHDVPRHGRWDEQTRRVLAVFQMKYRPSLYDGQPDAETAAWLQVATTPGGMRLADGRGGWAPYPG
jgi:N-acetylmuramoyl-L-alanine amidase